MTCEEFISAYIETDIIDESNAEWLYVADNGESQVLNPSTASAKSYLQFVSSLHDIIKRLQTSEDVVIIYRKEYNGSKVYVVRGMDR